MKNIVVDTSVAVKWFFPESGKDKALELKKQHLDGRISLCTRDLFVYEFISALRNYSSIKIEDKDFSLACSALNSLKMKYFPLEFSEWQEIFLLSKKLSLSVYDCSYILLAKRLKITLYTADQKLYRQAKSAIEMVII